MPDSPRWVSVTLRVVVILSLLLLALMLAVSPRDLGFDDPTLWWRPWGKDAMLWPPAAWAVGLAVAELAGWRPARLAVPLTLLSGAYWQAYEEDFLVQDGDPWVTVVALAAAFLVLAVVTAVSAIARMRELAKEPGSRAVLSLLAFGPPLMFVGALDLARLDLTAVHGVVAFTVLSGVSISPRRYRLAALGAVALPAAGYLQYFGHAWRTYSWTDFGLPIVTVGLLTVAVVAPFVAELITRRRAGQLDGDGLAELRKYRVLALTCGLFALATGANHFVQATLEARETREFLEQRERLMLQEERRQWEEDRRQRFEALTVECPRSAVCRDSGACQAEEARMRCVVGDPEGCRASTNCRRRGECSLLSSGTGEHRYCGPRDDAECRRAERCANEGACQRVVLSETTGYAICAAGSKQDCASSLHCRTLGHCERLPGRFGHYCGPASDEMCRSAPGCSEQGLCKASAGPLVRCVPGGEEDCRQATRCRHYAECEFEEAEGGGGGSCVRKKTY